jgi:hypothetical protein
MLPRTGIAIYECALAPVGKNEPRLDAAQHLPQRVEVCPEHNYFSSMDVRFAQM